jgi:GTP-binding protein EngB required for normal cell division
LSDRVVERDIDDDVFDVIKSDRKRSRVFITIDSRLSTKKKDRAKSSSRENLDLESNSKIEFESELELEFELFFEKEKKKVKEEEKKKEKEKKRDVEKTIAFRQLQVQISIKKISSRDRFFKQRK